MRGRVFTKQVHRADPLCDARVQIPAEALGRRDLGSPAAFWRASQPASVANIPRQPRYVVLGVTGILTPNLTNEINAGYDAMRRGEGARSVIVFEPVPAVA